jgi:delta24(24(1))-sterol reductase
MAGIVEHTDGPAANLRKRKSNSALNSDNIANGKSTALLKINAVPTEHGQEMDKKLDEHQSCVRLRRDRRSSSADPRYEFGGPVGVTAMMIGFPLLMCELHDLLFTART